MLYEYLQKNYKKNEPIFVSDLNLPVSDTNLRQMLKNLCDSNKIKRFDTGIYYIPKDSILKNGVPLTADEVAFAKYISRRGKICGFYSGYTFANQLGICTQVPFVKEIVSNNASMRVKEVKIRNKRIVLRKSRIEINEENVGVLQFLEMMKDLELYFDVDFSEVIDKVIKYVIDEKITKKAIDTYIDYYPDKIYKNIYKTGVYDVLA